MRLQSTIAAALAALAIAAPARAAQPLVPVDSRFQDEAVLEHLDSPIAARFAPPPDGRIFVAEKSGRVLAFDGPGDDTPQLVVDLRDEVQDFWDRGLLGMALDPGFATNRFLYLVYTRDRPIGGPGPPRWGDTCPDPPGATEDGCVVSGRLVRITVDELGVARDLTPLIEDEWCQQYPSHSVGTVAFGPDGMLYVGAGDGAAFGQPDYGELGGNPCGDPPNEGGSLRAQDVRTSGDPTGLDGAIAQLDPAPGSAPRIIAYGLRNPFRFAFRPGTDEIWLGDVGERVWDEIDRIPDAGDGVVENFGWPCFEGRERHARWVELDLPLCTSLTEQDVTPPVYAYPHYTEFLEHGGCAWPAGASSSGIAFHGSGEYPARYDGALFFADYSLGCIFAMRAGENGEPEPSTVEVFARPADVTAQIGGPVDLQVGPGGDLYYPLLDPVTPGEGSLRRIRYLPGNRPPHAAIAADPPYGDLPLSVTFSAAGSSDPDGDPVTFEWDLDGDGAFDDGTGDQAQRTYAERGPVRVGVRVSDASGAAGTAFVDVAPGNTPPVLSIQAPASWSVGEKIAFHGSAVDAQDGPLPASALHWVIALEHCASAAECHVHPLEQRDGTDGGVISGPEHEYPSRLLLKLTATDSGGLTGASTLRLEPRPAVVSAATDPQGGVVSIDGEQGTAVRHTVIAGARVTVATEPRQTIGGIDRAFAGWSDGDAARSRVIRPAGDVTLAARFPAPAGGVAGAQAVPARDTAAPRLHLRWPRSHRIDRRRLTVRLHCSEACTLSARAELRGAGHRLRLPVRLRGHARAIVTLNARARSRARAAVRRRHAVLVRLTLLARDAAGNRARVVRSFRLR